MSNNASAQVIENRYNHCEVVINYDWQYDQRAVMAFEILKEILRSKQLSFGLHHPDIIVEQAFNLENAFYLGAISRDMTVSLPGETPLRSDQVKD